MLERDSEHAFEHTLHGGTGRTTIQYHFADTMRMPVAVQTWTLEPGASEGDHAHAQPEIEEFYLVLSGRGTMHLDDRSYDLSAGDSVLAPPQASRGVTNTGEEPLRVLVVWGPPGKADFSGYGTHRKSMSARAGSSAAPDSGDQDR